MFLPLILYCLETWYFQEIVDVLGFIGNRNLLNDNFTLRTWFGSYSSSCRLPGTDDLHDVLMKQSEKPLLIATARNGD